MYDHYDSHTGDPTLDMEPDRNFYGSRMPEAVKKFLNYFRNVIHEGVVFETQNLYENTFPKLSEQHFEKQAWPDPDDVESIVGEDHIFMILYKELYYRHIHAKIPGGPNLDQRVYSFMNYCEFFNLILSSETPVNLELPDIWLWELVDEFVYQFQNFAQYRARLNDKTPEELDQLYSHNSKVSF